MRNGDCDKPAVKFCIRVNLRTLIGSFMAIAGTWQILYRPQALAWMGYSSDKSPSVYVWGWGIVPIVIGGFLLAWGEFCEERDR